MHTALDDDPEESSNALIIPRDPERAMSMKILNRQDEESQSVVTSVHKSRNSQVAKVNDFILQEHSRIMCLRMKNYEPDLQDHYDSVDNLAEISLLPLCLEVYWPIMANNVAEYVATCDTCATDQSNNHVFSLSPLTGWADREN